MILEDYLNLITSEHRDKPKFISMVSTLDLVVHIQNVIASMIPLFDVDNAVGDQQNILGQWIGISRNVDIPISGAYFSWDGDFTLGWDYGSWQPSTAPTNIAVLPDDAYKTLLKAKIAANHWDGTTTGAYAIWETIFTTFKILIQDHSDMSYDLIVLGGIVDSLTLALITNGVLPLKPEGVHINEYFVSVDTNPAFAWDLDSALLKGWDQGSWLREFNA